MSWIDTLFGGGREQAGKDMYNQYNQGMQGGQQLMNPYIGNSQAIYNQYLNAINQGMDPNKLYNKFASQYQMSPEAQAQIQQGIQGANRAAAAGGMGGSGAEMTAASNVSQSVRSSDFDKYMNNVLGLRQQYLGGIGGLENQGFQGSEFEAGLNQRYYEDMAKAKADQDQGRAGGWANALGAGINAVGGLFGGGFGQGFGQGFSDAFQGGSTWLDPDTGHYYAGG